MSKKHKKTLAILAGSALTVGTVVTGSVAAGVIHWTYEYGSSFRWSIKEVIPSSNDVTIKLEISGSGKLPKDAEITIKYKEKVGVDANGNTIWGEEKIAGPFSSEDIEKGIKIDGLDPNSIYEITNVEVSSGGNKIEIEKKENGKSDFATSSTPIETNIISKEPLVEASKITIKFTDPDGKLQPGDQIIVNYKEIGGENQTKAEIFTIEKDQDGNLVASKEITELKEGTTYEITSIKPKNISEGNTLAEDLTFNIPNPEKTFSTVDPSYEIANYKHEIKPDPKGKNVDVTTNILSKGKKYVDKEIRVIYSYNDGTDDIISTSQIYKDDATELTLSFENLERNKEYKFKKIQYKDGSEWIDATFNTQNNDGWNAAKDDKFIITKEDAQKGDLTFTKDPEDPRKGHIEITIPNFEETGLTPENEVTIKVKDKNTGEIIDIPAKITEDGKIIADKDDFKTSTEYEVVEVVTPKKPGDSEEVKIPVPNGLEFETDKGKQTIDISNLMPNDDGKVSGKIQADVVGNDLDGKEIVITLKPVDPETGKVIPGAEAIEIVVPYKPGENGKSEIPFVSDKELDPNRKYVVDEVKVKDEPNTEIKTKYDDTNKPSVITPNKTIQIEKVDVNKNSTPNGDGYKKVDVEIKLNDPTNDLQDGGKVLVHVKEKDGEVLKPIEGTVKKDLATGEVKVIVPIENLKSDTDYTITGINSDNKHPGMVEEHKFGDLSQDFKTDKEHFRIESVVSPLEITADANEATITMNFDVYSDQLNDKKLRLVYEYTDIDGAVKNIYSKWENWDGDKDYKFTFLDENEPANPKFIPNNRTFKLKDVQIADKNNTGPFRSVFRSSLSNIKFENITDNKIIDDSKFSKLPHNIDDVTIIEKVKKKDSVLIKVSFTNKNLPSKVFNSSSLITLEYKKVKDAEFKKVTVVANSIVDGQDLNTKKDSITFEISNLDSGTEYQFGKIEYTKNDSYDYKDILFSPASFTNDDGTPKPNTTLKTDPEDIKVNENGEIKFETVEDPANPGKEKITGEIPVVAGDGKGEELEKAKEIKVTVAIKGETNDDGTPKTIVVDGKIEDDKVKFEIPSDQLEPNREYTLEKIEYTDTNDQPKTVGDIPSSAKTTTKKEDVILTEGRKEEEFDKISVDIKIKDPNNQIGYDDKVKFDIKDKDGKIIKTIEVPVINDTNELAIAINVDGLDPNTEYIISAQNPFISKNTHPNMVDDLVVKPVFEIKMKTKAQITEFTLVDARYNGKERITYNPDHLDVKYKLNIYGKELENRVYRLVYKFKISDSEFVNIYSEWSEKFVWEEYKKDSENEPLNQDDFSILSKEKILKISHSEINKLINNKAYQLADVAFEIREESSNGKIVEDLKINKKDNAEIYNFEIEPKYIIDSNVEEFKKNETVKPNEDLVLTLDFTNDPRNPEFKPNVGYEFEIDYTTSKEEAKQNKYNGDKSKILVSVLNNSQLQIVIKEPKTGASYFFNFLTQTKHPDFDLENIFSSSGIDLKITGANGEIEPNVKTEDSTPTIPLDNPNTADTNEGIDMKVVPDPNNAGKEKIEGNIPVETSGDELKEISNVNVILSVPDGNGGKKEITVSGTYDETTGKISFELKEPEFLYNREYTVEKVTYNDKNGESKEIIAPIDSTGKKPSKIVPHKPVELTLEEVTKDKNTFNSADVKLTFKDENGKAGDLKEGDIVDVKLINTTDNNSEVSNIKAVVKNGELVLFNNGDSSKPKLENLDPNSTFKIDSITQPNKNGEMYEELTFKFTDPVKNIFTTDEEFYDLESVRVINIDNAYDVKEIPATASIKIHTNKLDNKKVALTFAYKGENGEDLELKVLSKEALEVHTSTSPETKNVEFTIPAKLKNREYTLIKVEAVSDDADKTPQEIKWDKNTIEAPKFNIVPKKVEVITIATKEYKSDTNQVILTIDFTNENPALKVGGGATFYINYGIKNKDGNVEWINLGQGENTQIVELVGNNGEASSKLRLTINNAVSGAKYYFGDIITRTKQTENDYAEIPFASLGTKNSDNSTSPKEENSFETAEKEITIPKDGVIADLVPQDPNNPNGDKRIDGSIDLDVKGNELNDAADYKVIITEKGTGRTLEVNGTLVEKDGNKTITFTAEDLKPNRTYTVDRVKYTKNGEEKTVETPIEVDGNKKSVTTPHVPVALTFVQPTNDQTTWDSAVVKFTFDDKNEDLEENDELSVTLSPSPTSSKTLKAVVKENNTIVVYNQDGSELKLTDLASNTDYTVTINSFTKDKHSPRMAEDLTFTNPSGSFKTKEDKKFLLSLVAQNSSSFDEAKGAEFASDTTSITLKGKFDIYSPEFDNNKIKLTYEYIGADKTKKTLELTSEETFELQQNDPNKEFTFITKNADEILSNTQYKLVKVSTATSGKDIEIKDGNVSDAKFLFSIKAKEANATLVKDSFVWNNDANAYEFKLNYTNPNNRTLADGTKVKVEIKQANVSNPSDVWYLGTIKNGQIIVNANTKVGANNAEENTPVILGGKISIGTIEQLEKQVEDYEKVPFASLGGNFTNANTINYPKSEVSLTVNNINSDPYNTNSISIGIDLISNPDANVANDKYQDETLKSIKKVEIKIVNLTTNQEFTIEKTNNDPSQPWENIDNITIDGLAHSNKYKIKEITVYKSDDSILEKFTPGAANSGVSGNTEWSINKRDLNVSYTSTRKDYDTIGLTLNLTNNTAQANADRGIDKDILPDGATLTIKIKPKNSTVASEEKTVKVTYNSNAKLPEFIFDDLKPETEYEVSSIELADVPAENNIVAPITIDKDKLIKDSANWNLSTEAEFVKINSISYDQQNGESTDRQVTLKLESKGKILANKKIRFEYSFKNENNEDQIAQSDFVNVDLGTRAQFDNINFTKDYVFNLSSLLRNREFTINKVTYANQDSTSETQIEVKASENEKKFQVKHKLVENVSIKNKDTDISIFEDTKTKIIISYDDVLNPKIYDRTTRNYGSIVKVEVKGPQLGNGTEFVQKEAKILEPGKVELILNNNELAIDGDYQLGKIIVTTKSNPDFEAITFSPAKIEGKDAIFQIKKQPIIVTKLEVPTSTLNEGNSYSGSFEVKSVGTEMSQITKFVIEIKDWENKVVKTVEVPTSENKTSYTFDVTELPLRNRNYKIDNIKAFKGDKEVVNGSNPLVEIDKNISMPKITKWAHSSFGVSGPFVDEITFNSLTNAKISLEDKDKNGDLWEIKDSFPVTIKYKNQPNNQGDLVERKVWGRIENKHVIVSDEKNGNSIENLPSGTDIYIGVRFEFPILPQMAERPWRLAAAHLESFSGDYNRYFKVKTTPETLLVRSLTNKNASQTNFANNLEVEIDYLGDDLQNKYVALVYKNKNNSDIYVSEIKQINNQVSNNEIKLTNTFVLTLPEKINREYEYLGVYLSDSADINAQNYNTKFKIKEDSVRSTTEYEPILNSIIYRQSEGNAKINNIATTKDKIEFDLQLDHKNPEIIANQGAQFEVEYKELGTTNLVRIPASKITIKANNVLHVVMDKVANPNIKSGTAYQFEKLIMIQKQNVDYEKDTFESLKIEGLRDENGQENRNIISTKEDSVVVSKITLPTTPNPYDKIRAIGKVSFEMLGNELKDSTIVITFTSDDEREEFLSKPIPYSKLLDNDFEPIEELRWNRKYKVAKIEYSKTNHSYKDNATDEEYNTDPTIRQQIITREIPLKTGVTKPSITTKHHPIKINFDASDKINQIYDKNAILYVNIDENIDGDLIDGDVVKAELEMVTIQENGYPSYTQKKPSDFQKKIEGIVENGKIKFVLPETNNLFSDFEYKFKENSFTLDKKYGMVETFEFTPLENPNFKMKNFIGDWFNESISYLRWSNSETNTTSEKVKILFKLKDQNGDYNKLWNPKWIKIYAKMLDDPNATEIPMSGSFRGWWPINSGPNESASFNNLKTNRRYQLTRIVAYFNQADFDSNANGKELKLDTNNPQERILLVNNKPIPVTKDNSDKIRINKVNRNKIVTLRYSEVDGDLDVNTKITAKIKEKGTTNLRTIEGIVIADNKIKFEVDLDWNKTYIFDSFYASKKPIMVKDYNFTGQPEIIIDKNHVVEEYDAPEIAATIHWVPTKKEEVEKAAIASGKVKPEQKEEIDKIFEEQLSKVTYDPSGNSSDNPKVIVNMNSYGTAYFDKEFEIIYNYKVVENNAIVTKQLKSRARYNKTNDSLIFDFKDQIISNNLYNKVFNFVSLKPVGTTITEYNKVEPTANKTKANFATRSEIQYMRSGKQLDNKTNRADLVIWYDKKSTIFEVYKYLKYKKVDALAGNSGQNADFRYNLFYSAAAINMIGNDGAGDYKRDYAGPVTALFKSPITFDLDATEATYPGSGIDEFYKPIVYKVNWKGLEDIILAKNKDGTLKYPDPLTGKHYTKLKIQTEINYGIPTSPKLNTKWDMKNKFKDVFPGIRGYETGSFYESGGTWPQTLVDYGDVFTEHTYRYDWSDVNFFISYAENKYDLVEIVRANNAAEVISNGNSITLEAKLKLNSTREDIEARNIVLKYSYLDADNNKIIISADAQNIAGTNKWSFTFNNLPYDKHFKFESIDFNPIKETIDFNRNSITIHEFKTKAQDLKLVWNNNSNNEVPVSSNGIIYLDVDKASMYAENARIWGLVNNAERAKPSSYSVRIVDKNDPTKNTYTRTMVWDPTTEKFKIDLFRGGSAIPYGQRTYELQILNNPSWEVPSSFNMWQNWPVNLTRPIDIKVGAKPIRLTNGAITNLGDNSLTKTFDFTNLPEYELVDGDTVVINYKNKTTNENKTPITGRIQGNKIIADFTGLEVGQYEITGITKPKKPKQWTDYVFAFDSTANKGFEIKNKMFVQEVKSIKRIYWVKDEAETTITFREPLQSVNGKKIRLIYNDSVISSEVALINGAKTINVKHPNTIMPDTGANKYTYSKVQILENGNWVDVPLPQRNANINDTFYLTLNPFIDPEEKNETIYAPDQSNPNAPDAFKAYGTEANKSFPSFVSDLKLGARGAFTPGHKYELIISSWKDLNNKRSFEIEGFKDNGVDIKKEYYTVRNAIADSTGRIIINKIPLTPNQNWNILKVVDLSDGNKDLKIQGYNLFRTSDRDSNSWYLRTWGAAMDYYFVTPGTQPTTKSWSKYNNGVVSYTGGFINMSIKGYNTALWNGPIFQNKNIKPNSVFLSQVTGDGASPYLRMYNFYGNAITDTKYVDVFNDPSIVAKFENNAVGTNVFRQPVLVSYSNIADNWTKRHDNNKGVLQNSTAGKIWYETRMAAGGNSVTTVNGAKVTIQRSESEPKDSIVKIENNVDKRFNIYFGKTRDFWDNMNKDKEDATISKTKPVARK